MSNPEKIHPRWKEKKSALVIKVIYSKKYFSKYSLKERLEKSKHVFDGSIILKKFER